MKLNNVTASLRSVKSSPQKIMRITKSLNGISVTEALKLLKYSRLKVSFMIEGLIKSSVANAENNFSMDQSRLVIHEINVGRAKYIKRFSARGRGKSSSVRKHYSNIYIKLVEIKLGE